MPNVGLFTATEPLPRSYQVSIRYVIEVEGLPVYTELYDVDTLAKELEEDSVRAFQLWERRLKAPVEARHLKGFSASVTEYLADGKIKPHGKTK